MLQPQIVIFMVRGLLTVVAGMGFGLAAVSPGGPAEPASEIVRGADGERRELSLDFVPGKRDQCVQVGAAWGTGEVGTAAAGVLAGGSAGFFGSGLRG